MDLSSLCVLSKKALFLALHSGPRGLASHEAAFRLQTHGPNQIESTKLSWLRLLAKQLASPFVSLLIVSAVVSFLFGDQVSAWMILGFVALNALLGFFQEYRAEKAVALLQALLRPFSTVFRDGKHARIPCIDIVPGDLCLLEAGDIIPADGVIVESDACLCDESVLTGESFPVTKESAQPLFAGTKMTQGFALFVVAFTGHATSLGNIAVLTSRTVGESSYQHTLRRLSVAILWFVVIAMTITFVLRIVFPQDSTLNWIQFTIFSVALAVSVIPETLPLVVTICLSRGALLMAKKQVVVKRLSSMEALGSIQILCTDKTGTLTQNNMHVADLHACTGNPKIMALHCVEPSRLTHPDTLDPFNRALVRKLSKEDRAFLQGYVLQTHIPFDPKRKRVTAYVVGPKECLVVACGASEEILQRCVHVDPAFRAWVLHQGKQGRRVLTVAMRAYPSKSTLTNLDAEERDMILSGGISFEDPLKLTSCSALEKIKKLGVQVKMLTGDSPEVATTIARQAGLIEEKEAAMTGDAFFALSATERRHCVQTCTVFARVDPAQKYAIIEALQHPGSVGFLGEGINDAPALKLAHVGIAVQEASDFARDAADIILLDKGLDVIAEGIITGRRVFVNIEKYIQATLVSNFGNFFAMIISLFFIPTLPMLPIQILLLNLLSDLPMAAICLDTVEDCKIRFPLRFPLRSLLSFCVVLGMVSTLFDFLFFTIYYALAPSHLQVMWFLASVFTELLLIFSLRSSGWFFQSTRPPRPLWITTALAALCALFVTFVPFFSKWFSFPRPTASLLLITFGLVILYFFLTDAIKRAYLRFVGGVYSYVSPLPPPPLQPLPHPRSAKFASLLSFRSRKES